MKTFLKVCAIGCGIILLLGIIGGIVAFFRFQAKKPKNVELRGYQTEVSGTAATGEFQQIAFQSPVKGLQKINWKDDKGFPVGLYFKDVNVGGETRSIVLKAQNKSLEFTTENELLLGFNGLLLGNMATGKIGGDAATTRYLNFPGGEFSDYSNIATRATESNSNNLSGKISFPGEAIIFIEEIGGQVGGVREVSRGEFSLKSDSKIFASEDARVALTGKTFDIKTVNDSLFFANFGEFTGQLKVPELNISESASKAFVATHARKMTEGKIERVQQSWRAELKNEAFQLILNERALIPAKINANPQEVTIKADGEGIGSTKVNIQEITGRGDAIIKGVKVEGEGKDFIHLPKFELVFTKAFEELPDIAKPFFAIPFIFGAIFIDSLIALFSPAPIPDTIFAGQTYTMVITSGPKDNTATMPDSTEATITFEGKNFDSVVIRIKVKK